MTDRLRTSIVTHYREHSSCVKKKAFLRISQARTHFQNFGNGVMEEHLKKLVEWGLPNNVSCNSCIYCLLCKSDSVDLNRATVFRWGDCRELLEWAEAITRVFIKGAIRRSESKRKRPSVGSIS